MYSQFKLDILAILCTILQILLLVVIYMILSLESSGLPVSRYLYEAVAICGFASIVKFFLPPPPSDNLAFRSVVAISGFGVIIISMFS